jgi:hypothetical protein
MPESLQQKFHFLFPKFHSLGKIKNYLFHVTSPFKAESQAQPIEQVCPDTAI